VIANKNCLWRLILWFPNISFQFVLYFIWLALKPFLSAFMVFFKGSLKLILSWRYHQYSFQLLSPDVEGDGLKIQIVVNIFISNFFFDKLFGFIILLLWKTFLLQNGFPHILIFKFRKVMLDMLDWKWTWQREKTNAGGLMRVHIFALNLLGMKGVTSLPYNHGVELHIY
jgi:hypothetical protein